MASEPVALINWIKSLCVRVERIGLEAGPLSQWLYGALRESGLAGGASGDAAREGGAVGDAGEDGSQRRARAGAADAAGLVPPGAL